MNNISEWNEEMRICEQRNPSHFDARYLRLKLHLGRDKENNSTFDFFVDESRFWLDGNQEYCRARSGFRVLGKDVASQNVENETFQTLLRDAFLGGNSNLSTIVIDELVMANWSRLKRETELNTFLKLNSSYFENRRVNYKIHNNDPIGNLVGAALIGELISLDTLCVNLSINSQYAYTVTNATPSFQFL